MKIYLKEWLETKAMKQKDLADKSGISSSYISQIANETKSSHQKTLDALSKGLGIATIELFQNPKYVQPVKKERIEKMVAAIVQGELAGARDASYWNITHEQDRKNLALNAIQLAKEILAEIDNS